MANHEKWASYTAYQFVKEKKYWFGYTKWFVYAITALNVANAKIIN